MPLYTQANRPLRIASPLGPDEVLLLRLTGAEAISAPYQFVVQLVSERADIDPLALLRQPVCVTLRGADGSDRHIHGQVRRFVQKGQSEGLAEYMAEIVPALWFLSLGQDCRIFQQQSVLEIVADVFQRTGLTDYAVRTTRSYPPREYCVQYRESHLAFVSRLLEEEGIFYFFEHTPTGHTLVLADAPGTPPACPGQSVAPIVADALKAHEADVILTWEKSQEMRTGRVTLTDYDPQNPTLDLASTADGAGMDERFDYPGKYATPDEGSRYAGLQMEAVEADNVRVAGSGTLRTMTAGHTFTLRDHYRRDMNAAYLLTQVVHQAHAGDLRSWDTAVMDYQNTFTAIPAATPYRPPLRTPKPRISGTHPAIVTGPPGDEIHVDAFGRVKVHFPWDRHGAQDATSSCWIRVASGSAGNGFGMISHPRIGQEVVVGYLEGDPDRPIVVGRVYNGSQPIPYVEDPTAMALKGKSTPAGSGTANELRMIDAAGREQVYLHSKKDFRAHVENNKDEVVEGEETKEVKKDRKKSVLGQELVSIGKDQIKKIAMSKLEDIGSDLIQNVFGGAQQFIAGTETKHVAGPVFFSTTAARSDSVALGYGIATGGDYAVVSKGGVSVTSDDKALVQAKKDACVESDEVLMLKAKKKIILSVADGAASIELANDGSIKISATTVLIHATASVEVTGSPIKLNC